jgi:hypothetical protein
VGVEAATARAAGPIAAAVGIGAVGLGVRRTEAGRAVVGGTGCPSIAVVGSPDRDSPDLAAAAAVDVVDVVDVSRRRTPSPSPFPSRAVC